jgi:hypothetical protein
VPAAQQAAPPFSHRTVYANLGVALVLHSVLVDGLQKMRHFAKAGNYECCLYAYNLSMLFVPHPSSVCFNASSQSQLEASYVSAPSPL